MTAIQQVFSGQETNYLLGQGKLFFAPINSITKLAEDKAKFVGNVPEEGFSIAPTVQTVQHNESITGKNRRDAVFHPGQSLTVTARLENVDLENLTQAMFGTSLKLLEATVSNEIHTAYKGYSFSLNRPNVGNLTIVNPSGLIFNQDYRVNLKTGEVFIPENSQIVDGSLVTVYYTAPPINRITGYTGLNTEVWVRFNGLNMANKLNPIIVEIFKVRFNPASVLDFLKNAFPGTQLELIGEALYEPRLERVADYEGGIFRIFSIGKTTIISDSNNEINLPNQFLTYCSGVLPNRPIKIVNLPNQFTIYCLQNIIRPADPPPPDPEIVLLLSGNGDNNSTNIIDSSSNPKSITTTGNVKISTDQSKFGGSSILINSGVVYSSSSLDFAFGSEDFTIEGWVYLLTIPSGFPDLFRTTDNLLFINFRQSGVFALTTPSAIIASSPSAIPLNQWSYFAVTRNGSTFRVFLNGVSGTPVTEPNLTFATNATAIRFGDGNVPLRAYIDEYRITKGVAREITLPTAPF